MMKYTIVLVFWLCATMGLVAQRNGTGLRSGQMQGYNPILSSSVNEFKGSGKDIAGSRFVFEGIGKEGVLYTGGQRYRTKGLNIDALENDILLGIETDSVVVLDRKVIDSLTIEGHLFKKLKGDDRFYEILFQHPEIVLVKSYDCDIIIGKMNVMKGTTENDRFKMTEGYLLKRKGQEVVPFRMHKKDVLDYFQNDRLEVKSFVNTNGLNWNLEEDVIRIFDFYYSKID